MHARRLVAVAYALAALTAPAALRAQELSPPRLAENPRGLFYHVHAGPTQIAFQDAESYIGVGVGGLAGYNFNRFLGLFVGFDFARPGIPAADFSQPGFTADDNFAFTHVELGGRVNVPLGHRLLPYVDAAYARRALSYSFLATESNGAEVLGRIKYVGNNVLVGGGVQFFLRPTIAADLGARVSFGELDHAQISMRGAAYTGRMIGDSGLLFNRVTGGVTWYYPKFELSW